MTERKKRVNLEMTERRQRRIVWICGGLIALAGFVALFLVDYGVIADRLKAIGYEPSAGMQALIDDVDVTPRGELVLKASQPTLLQRAEFNSTCESYNPDLSVLGCYAAERIYVYDVENEELDGIRQSTLAHELLHAAWQRMSNGERDKYAPMLREVYDVNVDEWQARLDKYPKESFYDELHSIVGTEVEAGELPEGLRAHYAEYFNNYGKIIGYYEAYSDKFLKLKQEAEELYAEITANQEKIKADTTNYNDGVVELNAAIEDFNRRAANGSFTSIGAFNAERAVLVERQKGIRKLYNEIADLEAKTNGLISKYNNNIARTQALVDSINSNTNQPEAEIKD